MWSEFISRHKKLHYVGKCIRQFSNDSFIDEVLYSKNNPYRIEYVCKGNDNPNINILVIPNICPINGFFAELRETMRLLAYADRYGFVPYVIYNNDYLYAEETPVNGTDNPYEYYFKQPSGLSLESVNHSFNLSYATRAHTQMIDLLYGIEPHTYEKNDAYISALAEIMKKYVMLNDETYTYIENGISGLFKGNERVLGIHHRGTDYKVNYQYHPRYISLDDKMNHIESMANNYDKIFIATDDAEALVSMEKRFGDKVCYYPDVYRSSNMVSVAFSNDIRFHHKYQLGLEVLRDMYTLSRCTGLIAGVSQVSLFAEISKLSRGEMYEDLYIFDTGINHEGTSLQELFRYKIKR